MDGTKKKKGIIRHYVDLNLMIGDKIFPTRFMVAGLGKQKITLDYPWFQKHNPEIDWKTGELNWRTEEPSNSKISSKKWLMQSDQNTPLKDHLLQPLRRSMMKKNI